MNNIKRLDDYLSIAEELTHITPPGSLETASPEEQNDIVKVRSAISLDPRNFEFASAKLRANKHLVMEVLSHSPVMYYFVHDKLKEDYDVISKALSGDLRIYYLLPDSVLSSRATMTGLYCEFPELLEFAQDGDLEDRELMLHVVMNSRMAFDYILPKFRMELEFVLEAAKVGCCFLKDDDMKFMDEKEVVLHLVKHFPTKLVHASERLRDDEEVVSEAVGRNGAVLGYASDRLQKDRSIVLRAIKNDAFALEQADDSLWGDAEVVKNAAERDIGVLQVLPDDGLRSNSEFMLHMIKRHSAAMKYVSSTLLTDRAFIMDAVDRNGFVYGYLPEDIRRDKEVMYEALSGAGVWLLKFAPVENA